MIEVEGLTKTFNVYRKVGRVRRARHEVHAVTDVSFAIGSGEMVGYIGPNGAGKSTTVKMLTGILEPSRGRVAVNGLQPSRQRVELARRIGVVFGQRSQLWWDLPLEESFTLLRHLYRVDAARHRKRLDECIDLLELAPFLSTPVRQLSLGQRMRGELTAAFLHEPSTLFLDEPTIGLDIVSKARVRDFLAEQNRLHGATVLLTTHDLVDIERLCSRIIVVDEGCIRYDGELTALREQYGRVRTLVIDLVREAPPIEVAGATVVRVEGPRQWLEFERDQVSASQLIAAVSAIIELRDLAVEEPHIEDIVRALARDSR